MDGGDGGGAAGRGTGAGAGGGAGPGEGAIAGAAGVGGARPWGDRARSPSSPAATGHDMGGEVGMEEAGASPRARSWASPRWRSAGRGPDEIARNSLSMMRRDLTERSIRIGDVVRQGLYTMATERVQVKTPRKISFYAAPPDGEKPPERLEMVSPVFAGRERSSRKTSPWWTMVLLLLLLGGYLCLGSGVMIALEFKHEDGKRADDAERCSRLVPLCTEALEAVKNGTVVPEATPEERELLLEALGTRCPTTSIEEDAETFRQHCRVGSYTSFAGNPWTFSGATYFSFTTLATIGFGDIFPHTSGGKIFICFYALFGIPLLFFTVQTISRVFVRIELQTRQYRNLRRIKHCLHRLACFCRLPREESSRLSDPPSLRPEEEEPPLVIHLIAGALFATVVCICLFALYSSQVHGFTYGNALYYAYISLSTIGFGDITPGPDLQYQAAGYLRTEATIWLETVAVMVFILVGLSILSFMVRSLIFGLEGSADQVTHALAFGAQSVLKEIQAGKMRLSSIKKRAAPDGVVDFAELSVVGEDDFDTPNSGAWSPPSSKAWPDNSTYWSLQDSAPRSPPRKSPSYESQDAAEGAEERRQRGAQTEHESLRLKKRPQKSKQLGSQRSSCSDLCAPRQQQLAPAAETKSMARHSLPVESSTQSDPPPDSPPRPPPDDPARGPRPPAT